MPEGKEAIEKVASMAIERKKNRNRRFSDPRFLSRRRKEYLENQGGPV